MTGTEDHLADRLRLRQWDELDGAQRETYLEIHRYIVPMADTAVFTTKLDDGRLIGPINPFLVSPAICAACMRLTAVEARESALDARVRQVVILTVGTVCKASY